MTHLETYCDHLYNFIYTPIYIFEDRKLIRCFPSQPIDYYPPQKYLDILWESPDTVTYTSTQQYTYFGIVHITDGPYSIAVGPVGPLPFNTEILLDMCKDYVIDSIHQEDFFAFFRNIPSQNQYMFLNMLLFINYSLNQTKVKKEDFYQFDGIMLDQSIKSDYTNNIYQSKEHGTLQNNYIIERQLIKYIETGNLQKIEELSRRARDTQVGIIANDNLRQLKNIFIVTITLVSRAAIKGGLSPPISYALTDAYLQQLECLNNTDSIVTLLYQVQHDFCSHVANLQVNPMANDTLHKIIDYVHKNTNTNLKVEEIAKEFGFSRTHLSRKFSKELGFSLSNFIRRCKLEESKSLLAYTEKSISQISSYLCFSSQSHFQKAFKNQYGITPYEYRKSNLSKS